MGGKNRAIEAAPDDEKRKKEEEIPQESDLTTPEITILFHNHLSERVDSARAVRNQKRNERNQITKQYNDMFEQQFEPLDKEYHKLSMEIFNLKAKLTAIKINLFKTIDYEEIKKFEEDISIIRSMNLSVELEEDEIIKGFFISFIEAEALKKEREIFKKSTEALDNIPLYGDRLIATEKLTKQETVLFEKEIQLCNSDIKSLHKRIEIKKKEKELLEKEKTLLNKAIEIYTKKPQFLHEEKPLTADTLRKKLCVKYKELDDREMERDAASQVIEAIRSLLFKNYDTSSKSTGTKEMMEILNKEWNFEYEKDRNPDFVFHKLVQCANKRMGFFTSWYSQSSFFGGGRKDWVHELYITLRFIKNNKGKFSPQEAVDMFNRIKIRAKEQSLKDNHISNIHWRI